MNTKLTFSLKTEEKCQKDLDSSNKLTTVKMRGVRVYQFGDLEVLHVERNLRIPNLKSGQVLVRVVYAGVNPNETYIREGNHANLPELPYTPGTDATGYIDALGPNIPSVDSDLRVGERVFVTGKNSGSYAEFIITESVYVFKLHQRLSLLQGAALGVPYFTAYKAVILGAKIRPGEKILIHGASGAVGTAAVQISRSLGLVVVGTASTDEGMEVAKACGAHFVFNHSAEKYEEEMLSAVGGDGFDVIIEHLANINLGKDFLLLKPKARIMVVGCRGVVEVNPRILVSLEASVKGVNLDRSEPAEWRRIGSAISAGIEAGWVRPVINRVYSMEQVRNVHHDMINLKGAKGKLLIKVSPDVEMEQIANELYTNMGKQKLKKTGGINKRKY